MKVNVLENGVAITRDMTPEEEAEVLSQASADIRTYEQCVEDFIRERYSISQEIAILRQKTEKKDENEEWYTYAETCKQKACILRRTAAVGAVVQRPLCGLSSGRN